MTARSLARLIAVIAACCAFGLADGSAAANGPAAVGSVGSWQVVLAAGDFTEPVFDNATLALSQLLIASGTPSDNIQRLSASAAELGPTAGRTLKETLLQRIGALAAQPGDRCLVFLTSHGVHGGGLWLAPLKEVLSPTELAEALTRGCAGAPTVAIVSACYSGAFAAPPMTAPNRIILTASRADRPSFGCEADRTYTFFDECLLAALPRVPSWRAVFDDTRACVHRLETQMNETPSEPQAWFGQHVARLTVRLPAR